MTISCCCSAISALPATYEVVPLSKYILHNVKKNVVAMEKNDFHVTVTPPEVLGLKYFLLGGCFIRFIHFNHVVIHTNGEN